MKQSAAQLAGVTSDIVFPRSLSDVEKQLSPFLTTHDVRVHLVPGRLQETVTCGPVSLCMAADFLVGPHEVKTCHGLIDRAIELGFSTKGEMFDCESMAALARDYFGLQAQVEQDWSIDFVTQQLYSGSLILVPYDVSANFEPALYEGEKSHWAVIVGLVYKQANASTFAEINKTSNLAAPESRPSHFACVQPKSKRIGAWNAEALVESNANLAHCFARREEGKCVPERLEDTLARRVVVLSKEAVII